MTDSRKNPMSIWFPRVLLAGFLVLAILFAVVGYNVSGWQREFMNRSQETTLLVARIDSRISPEATPENPGENRLYRPVFERVDRYGQVRSYAGNFWNVTSPHKAGETVGGRFDPQSGEMVSDKILNDMRWFGRIFYITTAIFLALAVGVILFIRRRRAPETGD